MATMFPFGICALVGLALAGSTAPPERPREVPPGADPRLLDAITKANSDFEIAMIKSNTRPIVAPYTVDAVFVSVDGTATKGRDQIERLYRDRFSKSGPAVQAKIESHQLIIAGDVAYERGRGSITRDVKGKLVTDRARFLTVWRRQPDGDWKIFRNIVLPGR